MEFWKITIADWLLIAATCIGPILAVQAQKWVERFRDDRIRRLWVFHTLMATRAPRANSAEHVQALNLINITFRGRATVDRDIRNAWSNYLDHLTADVPTQEVPARQHNEKGVDLLVTLLQKMASALGYQFADVEVKKGAYFPNAQAHDAIGRAIIRDSLVGILQGRTAIPMDVVGFPVSQEAMKAQMDVQKALLALLDGSNPLRVQQDPATAVQHQPKK